MERRLTTILSADVVGYSRLMGRDDAGTLEALKALRHELLTPKENQYAGRTVKLMGDGALMEFASVVDAVCFAVEVQIVLHARNANIPEDRRIVFRIGINIGDIIVDRDDIYGDGVNVAARLEGLCEPGGIALSRNVFNQVKDKLDLTFECLGEKEVKNIAEPVTVYRILLDEKAAALMTPLLSAPTAASNSVASRRLPGIAAGLLLSFAAIGGLLWWQPWSAHLEPASEERMAFPLPDKPSIAVLPFDNLSDDPNQDYFADGMAEDLITDLSKISGLFVIARNSSFSYKGQQVKIAQVAEDLGVRYVLEGSVRRAGEKVRINAQLIDATTGGHIWAERFDDQLEDVFQLQDDVVGSIVAALAVELSDEEALRQQEDRNQTGSLKAHEHFLRGKQHLSRFTMRDALKAKEFFEKAIELDPTHVRALSALGQLHYNQWEIWGKDRDRNLARALELGEKAVAVDETAPDPHLLLSRVYLFLREPEKAEAEANKALALEPREAETLAGLGDMLRWYGRAEEAVDLLKRAMRLDPFYPAWYEFYLGDVLFQERRYEEAIATLKRGAKRNPNYPPFHLFMAGSYAMLGREEEAKAAAAEVLRINPRFTLKAYVAHVPPVNEAVLQHELEAFRKAGLPE